MDRMLRRDLSVYWLNFWIFAIAAYVVCHFAMLFQMALLLKVTSLARSVRLNDHSLCS